MSTDVDQYEALFDSKFLRWFDIAGKEVPVTITSVKQEELTLRGGAKKKAPVITMEGKQKQLVLNRTNADSIAEVHGPKPSLWVGKRITLFVTTTNLKGKQVNCIRVKGSK